MHELYSQKNQSIQHPRAALPGRRGQTNEALMIRVSGFDRSLRPLADRQVSPTGIHGKRRLPKLDAHWDHEPALDRRT